MKLTKAMNVAGEAVKGGFLLFGGNTSASLILAAVSIAIARVLGPANYGLYSLAIVIPSLMLVFTDFGVNSALVKFSAQFSAEGRGDMVGRLIRISLLFKLVTGLSILVVSLLFADRLALCLLKRSDMGFIVQLSSLAIVGQVLLYTSNSVFAGVDRMGDNALTLMTRAVVKATIVAVFMIFGLGVFGAIVGHVFSYLAAGLLGVLMLFRICRAYRKDSKGEPSSIVDLRSIVRYGIPLYGSTLLMTFFSQYQSMALAWFASNVEVGNYSVATLFSAPMMLLALPISTALFPAFSKLHPDRDHRDLRSLFGYSSQYVLLLLVPASVLLAVASRDLVVLLYGSQYTLAPSYLVMYSTVFLYMGFTLVLESLFNGTGRTDIWFKATLIQTAIAIPLTPALTYVSGVPGLVASVIISTLSSLTYGLRCACRNFEMIVKLTCALRIYLAASLSAVPAFLLMQVCPFEGLPSLVLAALSFISAYLTLVPGVRAIDKGDLSNLRQVFGRIRLISQLVDVVLLYEAKILKLTSTGFR